MSLRPRAGARVPPSSAPLGSLHGAAIGFKPGRALPVGGPVTLKPEADEQQKPQDPVSQQELTPNLPTDVRELVDTMVWELKEGSDAAGNARYTNYQAGTVWEAYMDAAKEGTGPKTPILLQPMERDDYEELKAMYDRHNLLTPEERSLMQTLEIDMEWTEPYAPSAAYTERQEFHRQQNEEADAGAEAAARAELKRRLDTAQIAESRRRQAELERNAGGEEAFAQQVREEVLRQDDALTAEEARREARELEEAERQSLEQFAADERRRQERPRAASARNLQSAFDQAAHWTSNDAADPQSVARTAPPSAPPHWADDFRQSEIGEWFHRTFAEISDITENVDVDDPQFARRTNAVMSRTGPYTVDTVEVYVPPFPGELAPRLGDGDRDQVHNMLHTWVRNLLRIVMRYKTEGQGLQARDSARTLKQDIAQMQRRVDFQYKREVTSQFDMAVNYLIAELDPDEQVRRNAAMEMSSSLRPSGFVPPDERPPTAEDDDDAGLYHNDDGDAVTAWARDVTQRLILLYRQGYDWAFFQQRINELIGEGQPRIDLNIWLRNDDRAPVADEQDQLQAALDDWQTRAARLMQAWKRAREWPGFQVNPNASPFDEPRRLKTEWIRRMRSAPDSDFVPNFIGQQRVYDVFAEYISWLDTIYEPSFSFRVTIPVIYEDQI